MAKTARQAALTILERCRRGGAFSDALLGSVLDSAELEAKDRALAARLCYGVLQNAALCDFYIDSYSGGKKLEPKVRDILRLSVYQILFLDKIPSHAAVSEGVELCKKSGFARASGLVNAVLRRISENKNSLPPIPEDDRTKYLSVKYSHPLPLTELLISQFGEEFTASLLEANNEPVPTVIQVNTLKALQNEVSEALESRGFVCRVHPYLADCFEVSGGDVTATDEFRNGLFYVQDTAARMAVIAASPKSGDSVLDACAAPGGKSFASAIMMRDDGTVLSCDIHGNKLKLVSDGAKRLGIKIITISEMNAAQPDTALYGGFDVVIADVPCSGLGVIRKKPDIRYKELSAIEELPKKQKEILSALAPCVKPGGVLLYSTCTVLKRENEDVIFDFLSEHNEFSAESFTLPEPIGEAESGMLTLYPHIHGTDGFFICKLRRHDEN